MRVLSFVVKGISLVLFWISCTAVAGMVCVTFIDVIMRRSGRPLDFAFEIVCILAGLVIGFALPATSLNNDHVIVELIEKLPNKWVKAAHIVSRVIGIAIFATIGLGTLKLGNNLRQVGQCSPILQVPEFPLPYALSLACFVECLVLFYMLLKNLYPGEKRT